MPTFYQYKDSSGNTILFDDQFINKDIFRSGNLWSWGSNAYTQLATNDSVIRSTPTTTFAGSNDWKQISCGYGFMAGIRTDGSLWVWGNNNNAQLGTNDTTNRPTPVQTFAGGNNWRQVACGIRGICAIKTDGSLWSWGAGNGYGNGDNRNIRSSTPVTTFAGGNNWKQVSVSNTVTAAIKTDGTLWLWGSGLSGGLGNNASDVVSTPVTTFSGGNNWKQVSVGTYVSGAIKTDGTLWVWGQNNYARLGIGNTGNVTRLTPVTTFAGGNDWKSISVSSSNMAGVKTNGTLWTWGLNTTTFSSQGILGTNDIISRSTPVTTFAGGNNWKQATILGKICAAIKTDGTLWVWGGNTSGQLGDGTVISRSTPVTTFAGGSNWKDAISNDARGTIALTYVDYYQ